MKTGIKFLSLIMVLILSLTMFTGCSSSEEVEFSEDMAPITMTVALPIDSSVENWSDWESVLSVWIEDFKMFNNVTLEFTTIPTEGKALKKFKRKVANGKIACVVSGEQEFITDLIDDGALIDLQGMRNRFVTLMENVSDAVITLSQEKDLSNYKIPLYGSYQGLYYNRTLFKELELENPDSWKNIMAAIPVLKEKGYTPIAAGFADQGLDYFMEEMILSEGGTAEHSYMPSFGVVSSWERAVKSVKTLEKAGAFTKDCYNTSFDSAVSSFLDGKAAMIVAPSDSFGGQLSEDDVKVIGFPATPTGKREEGAFIGELSNGVYVSKTFFNDADMRCSEMMIELITNYFQGADFYNLVKNESTISANANYYDENGTTKMDEARGALIGKAAAADWPMSRYAQTYDNIMSGFRTALTEGKVTETLQAVTDKEIEAGLAAAEAEKAKDKD